MRDRGFTLIEVVIVLILISLSAALITPSLSRVLGTVELKSAAKTVAAVLRNSRNEAVQKGKVQQVVFNTDLREITFQTAETDNRADKKDEQKNIPPRKFFLPGGIQLKEVKTGSSQYASDLPVVEFYPNGGSNGASIILDRANNRGYRITVHFITGVVEVEGG